VYLRKLQAAGQKVMAIAGVDINRGSISASVTYRYAKNCLMLNSFWVAAHWRAVVAENREGDWQESTYGYSYRLHSGVRLGD
jgi:hypothetical protein